MPNRTQTALYLGFILVVCFSSCDTRTATATLQPVTVYSTSAAQPWLKEVYLCAEPLATLSRVDNASSADLVLRVGEPASLLTPAYQIDAEDILIVTHRQSPVQNLTLQEARALFAGQGGPSVQVWVYAPGDDVQDVFDRTVMAGENVTPSARIAVNPQQMSDTLVKEASTVGILPRHWKTGDSHEIFKVATVPILVIAKSEPQGVIKDLIACLQK